MTLKKYKATSPGLRHKISIDYKKDSIWPGSPLKSLSYGKISKNGKNHGLISSYHREGGNKKKYRLIDFKQSNLDIEGIVKRIEYDPNRSAYIALIVYKNGKIVYQLANEGLKIGDKVISSREKSLPLKTGNFMPLKDIALGSKISNLELFPKKGSQLIRSAGNYGFLIKKDESCALVRLRSKKELILPINSLASIGSISKANHKNIQGGKAGYSRYLGRRPIVRGVAMNPVDHPHGGGEGKTSGGRLSVSPWARLTKFYKTLRKKKK